MVAAILLNDAAGELAVFASRAAFGRQYLVSFLERLLICLALGVGGCLPTFAADRGLVLPDDFVW